MGLNWGQGLDNAAKGFDRMANQKNIEADMAYKEMAARNRERFAAGESKLQREFLSEEAETKRDWQEPLTIRGLENQEKATQLAGEAQQTRLEMQGDMADWNRQLGLANLGLSQKNTDIRQQQLDESGEAERARISLATAKERLAAYKEDMNILESQREVAAGKVNFMTPTEDRPALEQAVADAEQALTDRIQQNKFDKEVSKLSNDKQAMYEFLSTSIQLGNKEQAHKVAMAYANMDDKQRAQIEGVAKTYLDEFDGDVSRASAKAIMHIKSGKKVDLSKPPTTSKTPAPPTGETPTPANLKAAEDVAKDNSGYMGPGAKPPAEYGYWGSATASGPEPSEISQIRAIAVKDVVADGVSLRKFYFDRDVYTKYMDAAREKYAAQEGNSSGLIAKTGGAATATGPGGGFN